VYCPAVPGGGDIYSGGGAGGNFRWVGGAQAAHLFFAEDSIGTKPPPAHDALYSMAVEGLDLKGFDLVISWDPGLSRGGWEAGDGERSRVSGGREWCDGNLFFKADGGIGHGRDF
jgi:hypothetical protein